MTDASQPGFLRGFFAEFTTLRGAPRELWLIYGTKVLEILAYAAMNSILVLWLSADLGFSDARAGDVIAWWSTVITLVTVAVGSLVDAIGIKKSFLLGFWLCLASRGVMAFADSAWIALPLGMLPLAVGLALMVPVMNAALKRYATKKQQTMAFALFYMMMNLGFMLAGFLIDGVRGRLGELKGMNVLGVDFSTYQVLFLVATCSTAVGLLLTQLLMRRGVEGTDDRGVVIHEIQAKYKEEGAIRGTTLAMRDAGRDTVRIFASIWREPNFYRFLVFLSLIVLVRLVFYHMHYTFPKFGLRELGPGAKIGNLWTVLNAGIIFVLTVPVAALSSRISSYKMLAVGTSIAAVPVFLLALPPAWFQGLADGLLGHLVGHLWLGIEGAIDPLIIAIVLFVFFFSIGEAIWSPRLYQYTAAIAPKGKEGSYMALSLLPYFVAKLIVGMFSGRMLERWCPDDDVLARRYLVEKLGDAPAVAAGLDKEGALRALADRIGILPAEGAKLAENKELWRLLHDAYPRDSQTLWLVVAVMAILCPLGILLLRRVIASREDL
ncbi:MAG: MFS transporter [Planctomycetota bacterium]